MLLNHQGLGTLQNLVYLVTVTRTRYESCPYVMHGQGACRRSTSGAPSNTLFGP